MVQEYVIGTQADRCSSILLSVIVPVYNEERTIDEILRRVIAADCRKELIVVDDASNDRTAEVLQTWQSHPQVTVQRHASNRGKGAAIRTGLKHARAEYTIVQDADLEYDPSDYPKLLRPVLVGEADAVYGSRRLAERLTLHELLNPFYHGVSVLNALVRLWYGLRITDEATCYKLFPTQTLRMMELQCERFEFCPEVTAKAARLGLRIVEVPIHYQGRSIREGKKIRFRDGWEAILTLRRYRRWQPARTAWNKPYTTKTAAGAMRQAEYPAYCQARNSSNVSSD